MASKYTVKRDSYTFKITEGSFGDANAKGEATVKLIQTESSCGINSIPAIGASWTSVDGFQGNAASTTYTDIKLRSISSEYYHTTDDQLIHTLEYSSEGTEATEWENFRSDFQVIELENPTAWRYAQGLTVSSSAPYYTANTLSSSVQQKIVRKVLQGSIDLLKTVHPDQVDDFTDDYLGIAGKVNQDTIYVLGNSSSNAFFLNTGQLLVGGLSGGEKVSNLYRFRVEFQFRIINQDNAAGTAINAHDWNYVLAPIGTSAGWLIPLKLSGVDATTLASEPTLYPYTLIVNSVDEINTFINTDYSTPDP